MEPTVRFFSLLFVAGVALLAMGSAKSKDLRQHPFWPVWKVDGGRNGFLWAGSILTSGSAVVLLAMEVF